MSEKAEWDVPFSNSTYFSSSTPQSPEFNVFAGDQSNVANSYKAARDASSCLEKSNATNSALSDDNEWLDLSSSSAEVFSPSEGSQIHMLNNVQESDMVTGTESSTVQSGQVPLSCSAEHCFSHTPDVGYHSTLGNNDNSLLVDSQTLLSSPAAHILNRDSYETNRTSLNTYTDSDIFPPAFTAFSSAAEYPSNHMSQDAGDSTMAVAPDCNTPTGTKTRTISWPAGISAEKKSYRVRESQDSDSGTLHSIPRPTFQPAEHYTMNSYRTKDDLRMDELTVSRNLTAEPSTCSSSATKSLRELSDDYKSTRASNLDCGTIPTNVNPFTVPCEQFIDIMCKLVSLQSHFPNSTENMASLIQRFTPAQSYLEHEKPLTATQLTPAKIEVFAEEFVGVLHAWLGSSSEPDLGDRQERGKIIAKTLFALTEREGVSRKGLKSMIEEISTIHMDDLKKLENKIEKETGKMPDVTSWREERTDDEKEFFVRQALFGLFFAIGKTMDELSPEIEAA